MIITPFDVTIVMFLSTLSGILICEAYHLLTFEDYQDDETQTIQVKDINCPKTIKLNLTTPYNRDTLQYKVKRIPLFLSCLGGTL